METQGSIDFTCYWCKRHTISMLQRAITTQDIILQQLLPQSAGMAGLGEASPAELRAEPAAPAAFAPQHPWVPPGHAHPCCGSQLSCLPATAALTQWQLKRKAKKAVWSFVQLYRTLNTVTGCSKWIPVDNISAGGEGRVMVLDSKAVFIIKKKKKDMEISGYLEYHRIWSIT